MSSPLRKCGRHKTRIIAAAVMDEQETGLILRRLQEWPITGIGLHPGGSNYVFVVRLEPESRREDEEPADDDQLLAIYKPASGERPLRDFPYGTLHLRERAAWLLSRELGWPLVPPTVVRDGPHGEGSVQFFIDSDPRANFFTMRDDQLDRFAPIAMFDVLIQNADRKGGSCLNGTDGRLWAIDHGLTFNPRARQRTVMLEFCGRPYPEAELASIAKLSDSLRGEVGVADQLAEILNPREMASLIERADRMVSEGAYPLLDPNMNVPWPFI